MHRTEALFQTSITPRNSYSKDWLPPTSEIPEQPIDYAQLSSNREDWLSKLKLTATRTEIQNAPTEQQIEDFARYLVCRQVNDTEDVHLYGSWSLIRTSSSSDERVAFTYFPSYIALSYLALVKQDYPEISASIRSFDECLHRGFDFVVGRSLSGHGYDSTIEMLQAVDYLAIGRVLTFAKRHPDMCACFNLAVNRAKRQIRQNIEDRPTWGSVGIEQGKAALALLNGRDRDYQRVREIVFADWIRFDTAFAHDLVREISELIYQNVRDHVESEIIMSAGLVASDIDAERPKYTVFRHTRHIETRSHVLGITCNLKDTLCELRSHRAYMSDEYFKQNFERIVQTLRRDIERELFRMLSSVKEVNREQGFEVVISDIRIKENEGVEFRVCGRSI